MSNETGSLVQKLRLRHGWSQEQLAALCALNVRTIQRIESGQPPSLETLRALASVFEIDITALKEPEMDRPTMPSVSQDEMLAFAQVRRIKGFYLHLIQYLVAVGAMAIVNAAVYPRYPWVIWVALGWGSGLLIHGLKAFDKVPYLTPAWERRQVERQLGRKL